MLKTGCNTQLIAKVIFFLIDYPYSEMQGGGPIRIRQLTGDIEVIKVFKALLVLCGNFSQEFQQNANLIGPYLAAISHIALAAANGESLPFSVLQALESIELPLLPDSCGKSLASALADLQLAATEAFKIEKTPHL